jgi:hypothetical protein
MFPDEYYRAIYAQYTARCDKLDESAKQHSMGPYRRRLSLEKTCPHCTTWPTFRFMYQEPFQAGPAVEIPRELAAVYIKSFVGADFVDPMADHRVSEEEWMVVNAPLMPEARNVNFLARPEDRIEAQVLRHTLRPE